jgi:hypothetical protein
MLSLVVRDLCGDDPLLIIAVEQQVVMDVGNDGIPLSIQGLPPHHPCGDDVVEDDAVAFEVLAI